MGETLRRLGAFAVMIIFVMVMVIPVVSSTVAIETWFLTLIVIVVVVPLVIWFALGWSRKQKEERGDELLTWRGYTEEEWTEDLDPDDFEGEID
jgi:hypothetical protein